MMRSPFVGDAPLGSRNTITLQTRYERAQGHSEQLRRARLIAGHFLERSTHTFPFHGLFCASRIGITRQTLSAFEHSARKVFGKNDVAGTLQNSGQERLTQFADVPRIAICEQAFQGLRGQTRHGQVMFGALGREQVYRRNWRNLEVGGAFTAGMTYYAPRIVDMQQLDSTLPYALLGPTVGYRFHLGRLPPVYVGGTASVNITPQELQLSPRIPTALFTSERGAFGFQIGIGLP